MNTIDSAPDREPSERTAEPKSIEGGTLKKMGTAADALHRYAHTGNVDGGEHLRDRVDTAAEARAEPAKTRSGGHEAEKLEQGAGAQPGRPSSPGDTDKERDHPEAKAGETDAVASAQGVVPKSVAKRYLIAENKFYFRDDPNLMAFEDKGKRLSTEHNDPQVAQSMVELAQAKNWSTIKVSGTLEFKREVWLAGSLRGLEVQGYAPRAIDKARLAELRNEFQARRQNSIKLGAEREQQAAQPATPAKARPNRSQEADDLDAAGESYRNLTKQQHVAVDTLRAILTERGDSAQAVEMALNLAAERFGQQRVYVARLLAHGQAPYEHKPDEKMNYFVTLQTPYGEQTVWGVDLERAIGAANVKVGEDLALVARGKKKVTVQVNERDPAGKPTGRQTETVVDRNTWEIGRLDKMREETQVRVRTAAEQTARYQPEVRVYDVPVQPQRQVSEPAKARGREQGLSR